MRKVEEKKIDDWGLEEGEGSKRRMRDESRAEPKWMRADYSADERGSGCRLNQEWICRADARRRINTVEEETRGGGVKLFATATATRWQTHHGRHQHRVISMHATRRGKSR